MEQEAQRFKIHSFQSLKVRGNTLMKEENTVMKLLKIMTIAWVLDKLE